MGEEAAVCRGYSTVISVTAPRGGVQDRDTRISVHVDSLKDKHTCTVILAHHFDQLGYFERAGRILVCREEKTFKLL